MFIFEFDADEYTASHRDTDEHLFETDNVKDLYEFIQNHEEPDYLLSVTAWTGPQDEYGVQDPASYSGDEFVMDFENRMAK